MLFVKSKGDMVEHEDHCNHPAITGFEQTEGQGYRQIADLRSQVPIQRAGELVDTTSITEFHSASMISLKAEKEVQTDINLLEVNFQCMSDTIEA